jgi:hypothetical protein
MRLQHIGKARGLLQQFGIGDVLGRGFRIIGFPDDRGLVGAGDKVAVDAVGRDVQRAILEPFDRDFAKVEIGVFDLGIALDPVDALALLGPVGFGICHRGRVLAGIAVRLHMCRCDKLFRRGVSAFCQSLVCHLVLLFPRGCL